MIDVKSAANEYVAKTEGDDCLCQRSQPGTPVGEHLYVSCCCKIAEGFLAGAAWQREKVIKAIGDSTMITIDGKPKLAAILDALHTEKESHD